MTLVPPWWSCARGCTISLPVQLGSLNLLPLMCDSQYALHTDSIVQFSQSTRFLHVESFNPELIFLLDQPNNSSHPAPYIRWLSTFILGNRHEVRVWFGSHTLLNHINITCQYIIKFYLQYVHSFVTIKQYIPIYTIFKYDK